MLLAVIGYTAVTRGIGEWQLPQNHPWLAHVRPWFLAGISLLTALLLQAFVQGVGTSREIFLVLQLFVLTQFVLNVHLQPWEHGLRWLIIVGFWITARPHDWLSLMVLIAIGFGAFCLRHYFDTQWWPVLAFAAVIGSLYWASLPHLTDPRRLGYFTLYLATMSASAVYTQRARLAAQERAELLERLDHDTLTHAGNLNRLRNLGTQAFDRAQVTHASLAVAAIDIDHFKNYNDTYGHAAGDQVLIAITNKIYQNLPPSASLYRTGGEELTVLMPNFDQAQALALTTKLWQAIRQMTVAYAQYDLAVSLSAGVTTKKAGDTSLDDLSRRADASLYLSKQRGRDCITVDGKTLDNGKTRTHLASYTYFTQPILDLATKTLWQGELMRQVYRDNQWQAAPTMTIATLCENDSLSQLLPISRLLVNLDFDEVCTPKKAAQLCQWFTQLTAIADMVIELDRLDNVAAFKQILPQYRQAHIAFAMDVAGLPHSDAFIPELSAFALVKAPLPSLRGTFDDAALITTLRRWQTLAAKHHCRFGLDHIHSIANLHLAESLGVDFGEGDYLNKPILPRIV